MSKNDDDSVKMDDEMLQLGRQMDRENIASSLTVEQLERMEVNRQAALARKKLLQQQRQVSLSTVPTPAQMERAEQNRQAALAKRNKLALLRPLQQPAETLSVLSVHQTHQSSTLLQLESSGSLLSHQSSNMSQFAESHLCESDKEEEDGDQKLAAKKPRMQAYNATDDRVYIPSAAATATTTRSRSTSTLPTTPFENDDELLQLEHNANLSFLSIHQTSTLPSGEGDGVATAEIISLLDDSNHNVSSSGATEIISLLDDDSNHTFASSGGEGGDENVSRGNLKDHRDYIPSAAATATTRSRSTSTLLTTSNPLLQIVPYNSVYCSNLLDEEAEEEEEEEYQAREQLTEDEIDRLADAARRNRTSNIKSGLFSNTPVPAHHNDGDLDFDQEQYLLLAIVKWNALTERERLEFGVRNPVKPFYIFSGKAAVDAFDGLSPDEIEKLHITVLLGKLDVLAKALSQTRGDNSLLKLCGGKHNHYSNIDGARFVRDGTFLVANVQYTAEDESRFVNCQAVEGGLERVEKLRLCAQLNRAKAPLQILVSMNGGEIIHKYTSKKKVKKDLLISTDIFSNTQMRSEQGLTIDIGSSNSRRSHRPAVNQHALLVNFKISALSLAEFLAVPMAIDHDQQHKRMRSQRLIALCQREVQLLPIQQPGETSYKFVNVTAGITWAKGDGKDKYVSYTIGGLITEQDIVNAGPSGLDTIRTRSVPRGKGKWTWKFTGILTHTNSQTKVVRKFKKEHDGNYHEVIDDTVEGEEP